MTRALAVLLVVGLVLAPAAVAKGPHAILTSGPDALEPGKPWVVTVELNEFRRLPEPPRMIARQSERTITSAVEKAASSIDGARAFKLTTVFPSDGRWKLTLVAAGKRMRFPAVNVGSGEVPQDYVGFAVGSEAARQGAGGVYMEPESLPAGAGDDGVRSPEVFKAYEGSEDSDEATLHAWWLLPVAGVVLAGAGVATVRRRGSS